MARMTRARAVTATSVGLALVAAVAGGAIAFRSLAPVTASSGQGAFEFTRPDGWVVHDNVRFSANATRAWAVNIGMGDWSDAEWDSVPGFGFDQAPDKPLIQVFSAPVGSRCGLGPPGPSLDHAESITFDGTRAMAVHFSALIHGVGVDYLDVGPCSAFFTRHADSRDAGLQIWMVAIARHGEYSAAHSALLQIAASWKWLA